MSQQFSKEPEEKTESTAVTVITPPAKPIFELPENLAAYHELLDMLRYRRPHDSKSERKFIHEYLHPFGAELKNDKFGNYFMRIGDAPIMWSCHTDTVHNNKGMQQLGWCENEVGISEHEPVSNCLGADDTAGVWLMVQMMRAQRPGLYVFHRSEEIGCLGSKFIVKERKELVADIKFAVALDRKGKTDVITHQRSMRCCSDEFAKSLAEQLGMGFKPDDGGVYTDTAEYTDLIAECTNISVGYQGAHTAFERLDLDFIFRLRDVLLKLDHTKLVEHRKAGTVERKVYRYSGSGGWGGDDWGGSYGATGKWVGGIWIPNKGVKFQLGGAWFDGRWYADPAYQAAKSETETEIGNVEPGYTPHAGKSWWEQQKLKQDIEDAKREKAVADKAAANKAEEEQLKTLNQEAPKQPEEADDDFDDFVENSAEDTDDMIELVKSNPEACADILEQFGMGPRQLREEIASIYGVVTANNRRWRM